MLRAIGRNILWGVITVVLIAAITFLAINFGWNGWLTFGLLAFVFLLGTGFAFNWPWLRNAAYVVFVVIVVISLLVGLARLGTLIQRSRPAVQDRCPASNINGVPLSDQYRDAQGVLQCLYGSEIREEPQPQQPASQPTRIPPPKDTAADEPEPTKQPATPVIDKYPLVGQCYDGYVGDSHDSDYDACWTMDGRLWQEDLPTGSERVAHTVAITLEEGQYSFNAVECALYLDEGRNGEGSSNAMTAGYGNDLRFFVDTEDGGQAWSLVDCRGNFSTGFEVLALDW